MVETIRHELTAVYFGSILDSERIVKHVAHRDQTVAELYEQTAPPAYRQFPVSASVNGCVLDPEDWARPLGPDVAVLFVPAPGYTVVINALIYAVVALAVNLAYQALVAQPTDRNPQERGDERSPTYNWAAIQSEYRGGLPIPMLFGIHDVGGQAIHVGVRAQFNREELQLILSLSEGPIKGLAGDTAPIYGVDFDEHGGFNGQTTVPGPQIPSDIRVNGVRLDSSLTGTLQGVEWVDLPNAIVSYRRGWPGSRAYVGFDGTETTQQAPGELTEEGATTVAEISETNEIAEFSFVVSFPGGLYQQDNQGNVAPATVELTVEYREVGATAWIPAGGIVRFTFQNLASFAIRTAISTRNLQPFPSNVELRFRRLTPAPGQFQVTGAQLRQIGWRVDAQLGYGGVSTLGLRLVAGPTLSNARPQVRVRLAGILVRVWDDTIRGGQPSGFIGPDGDRYGDMFFPPDVSDYAGIWSYPPGQNPAWIFAAILWHPNALGRFLSDSDIDWPAIRDWADYCDEDVPVNGVNEARFQFNGPLDNPREVMEWLRAVCRAGNAMPVMRGRKISVVYRYRDAHGRGTNVVPSKATTQVFTTANVTDFSISYRNVEDRPAVLNLQFLNEAFEYAQDAIPIPDPDGGLEDPTELNRLGYSEETHQAFGVTRASQVYRLGLFMHATNRLVRSEVSFKVGIDALGCELGDVIAVEHVAFRPFDSRAFARRFTQASASQTTFTLTGDVTLPTGPYAIFRDAAGTVREIVLTDAPGDYPAGSTLTLASAQDMVQGTPVVIGGTEKLVRRYEVIGITLEQDLMRTVTAVLWTPDAYDTVDVGQFLGEDIADDASFQGPGEGGGQLFTDTSQHPPTDLAVARVPGAIGAQVSWQPPQLLQGERATVWFRYAGQVAWIEAGTTTATSLLVDLTAGETYDVAVAMWSRTGVRGAPQDGARITVTLEEFSPAMPPAPAAFTVDVDDSARLLTFAWPDVVLDELDAFEIRKGAKWLGAEVIYRGRDNRVVLNRWDAPGDDRTETFWLCTYTDDGRRSELVSATAMPSPDGDEVVDEEFSDTGSTAVNVTADGSSDITWAISGDNTEGTVESQAVDLTYEADGWLSVAWFVAAAEDLLTLDQLTWTIGSGEAAYGLLDGRPASPLAPGINPELTLDDLDADIASLTAAGVTLNGSRGTVGRTWQVICDYRTARDGETLSAQPWSRYDGPVETTARYFQARFTLVRNGTSSQRVLSIREPRIRFLI